MGQEVPPPDLEGIQRCYGLLQTASRRRRIARGAGRNEVDVTNMIGTFGGMRAKMQSLSKMMKMGGGAPTFPPSPSPLVPQKAS